MNKFVHSTSPTRGAAMLLLVVFFTMGSVLITLSIGRTAYGDVVRFRAQAESKQAFFAAESGIEDVVHRLRNNEQALLSATESLTVGGVTAVSTIDTVVNEKHITAEAEKNGQYRTSFARVRLGTGVSFSFGLQSGDGGLVMLNSSSVIGDVYANGTVDGTGTNASNGNYVYGHIVSAGSSGLVDGVIATGSIWAHSIQKATAQEEAYYLSLATSSVVVGTTGCPNAFCHPGSADQPTIPMPISTTTIAKWQADAEAGGVISSASPLCPLVSGRPTLTLNSSTTTGPKKIECDVVLEGNSTTLTLTGELWITGDLTIRVNADVAIDPALADVNFPLIVDDQVVLNQGGDFVGASGNSFIILISLDSNPGSEVAIGASNSVGGDALLYAPDGRVVLEQSIAVKEITAHTVELRNSAQIRYESGLMSLTVPDPDGGYSIEEWREVE